MTQDELDALLAKAGGRDLVWAPIDAKQKTPNPAASPKLPDGSDNPGYVYGSPPEVEQPVQSWTNPKTGYVIRAIPQPDGTWNVIQNDPRGTTVPASTQRTPEQQRSDAASATKNEADAANEVALNKERDWHEQQGHGRVTHAEYQTALDKKEAAARADLAQARADRNEARITSAQEATNQLARDRLNFDRDKADMPDVKVETVKGGDGKSYTKTVRTDKKGNTSVSILGPDGKPVQEIPGEKAFVSEPSGAPARKRTLGDITDDLDTYSKWLSDQVDKKLVTPDDADKLLARRYALAQSEAGEQKSVVDAQRGVYGDQITERGQTLQDQGNRRSNATDIYKSASDAFYKYGSQIIPSKDSGQTAVDAYRAALNLGKQYLGEMGADQPVPNVTVPPTIQRTMGVDGQVPFPPGYRGAGSGNRPADTEAGAVGPATSELGQPGDPHYIAPGSTPAPGGNALGLGSVGDVAAPHVVMHPGGAIEINPPAQNDPAPGAPGPGIDTPYQAQPINPPAGQPGNDASAPVGQFNLDDHHSTLTGMGLSDQEAKNALALYRQGVRADDLAA